MSVRRHQPPQFLEPVLDDDVDLRGARYIVGPFALPDYQEPIPIWGDVEALLTIIDLKGRDSPTGS